MGTLTCTLVFLLFRIWQCSKFGMAHLKVMFRCSKSGLILIIALSNEVLMAVFGHIQGAFRICVSTGLFTSLQTASCLFTVSSVPCKQLNSQGVYKAGVKIHAKKRSPHFWSEGETEVLKTWILEEKKSWHTRQPFTSPYFRVINNILWHVKVCSCMLTGISVEYFLSHVNNLVGILFLSE